MKKKEVKKSTAVDYVEVVDTKLNNSEDLDTLVRLPFIQLLTLGMDSFMQHLSILAIGKDDPGQFKLNNLSIKLAGVVDEDVIFRVQAKLEQYKVEAKRLPKVKRSKVTKKK